MSLPTRFYGSARVAALWNDLLADYRRSGGTCAALEALVDVGAPTDYIHQTQPRWNTPGVIESPEVMEYAYAQPRLYRLLSKHGFPVPFAMNDFNESDTIDDRWRTTIQEGVLRITRRIAGEQGAPAPGTDAYRRLLAQRIFTYVRGFIDSWEGDCEREADDWQALEQKCGACSESSAILLYAYQRAGLRPTFLILKDMRPTIDRLTMMEAVVGADNAYATMHVLIGVPLDDGTLLQIDPMSNAFDVDLQFAKRLSSRQYILATTFNRIHATSDEEMLQQRRLAFEMAPDEPTVLYHLILQEMPTLTQGDADVSGSLEERLAQMKRIHGDSPLAAYYIADLRMRFGNVHPKHTTAAEKQELKRAWQKAVDVLCEANPQQGAFELYAHAALLLRIVEEREAFAQRQGPAAVKRSATTTIDWRLEAFHLLKRSVLINPHFYDSLRNLHRAAKAILSPKGLLELYEELLVRFPEHHDIRYRFANSCFQIYRETGDGAYIEKGYEHARLLAEELEPENGQLAFLHAVFAIYLGKPNIARQELKRVERLAGGVVPKPFRGEWLAQSLHVAMQSADVKAFHRCLECWKKEFPDAWADQLVNMMLYAEWSIDAGEDGRDVSDDVAAERVSLLVRLFTEAAAGIKERPKLDAALARWGTIVLLSSGGKLSLAQPLFDLIVDVKDERVQAMLDIPIEHTLPTIFSREKLSTAGGHTRGRKTLDFLLHMAVDKKRPEIQTTYAHIARHAIQDDDPTSAIVTFRTMIALDPDHAATHYYDIVVRHFYTLLTSEKAPHEECREDARRLLQGLEPLWIMRTSLPSDMRRRLAQAYALSADAIAALGLEEGVVEARRRSALLGEEENPSDSERRP